MMEYLRGNELGGWDSGVSEWLAWPCKRQLKRQVKGAPIPPPKICAETPLETTASRRPLTRTFFLKTHHPMRLFNAASFSPMHVWSNP